MTPAKTDASKVDLQALYEQDYLQWIETTVEKLRQGDYSQVDWEHLIDEIEDMARSERRRLKSNLIVVLLHLLKWQVQPERRSGSCGGSIIEHRRRVKEAIAESPSLQPYLEQIFPEAYFAAVKQASAETEMPIATFPQACPYALETILNDDFLPE